MKVNGGWGFCAADNRFQAEILPRRSNSFCLLTETKGCHQLLQVLLPTATCSKEHRRQCTLPLAVLWHRRAQGAQVSVAGAGASTGKAWGWQVSFGRDSATPADFSAPRAQSSIRALATRPLAVSQPRVCDGHPAPGVVPKRAWQLLWKAPVPSLLWLCWQPWGLLLLP